MKRNMSLTALLSACSIFLTACSLSGRALEGRVAEEGTQKPIENAIVVARWKAHLAGIADGKTVCYHVLTTKTDDRGRYYFPAWKKPAKETWQKHLSEEEVLITVYKPGYQWPQESMDKKNVQYLTPAKGTSSERLAFLKRISRASWCGLAGDSLKNIAPLDYAIYEEARLIGAAPSDQKVIDYLLQRYERTEFGYEVAEKKVWNEAGIKNE
jgi:hypothetical protein